jgi:hypothetical protein
MASLSWLGRSFPDADDYAAGAIYLAFGLAFAVANFRFATKRHYLIGSVLTLTFGSLGAFCVADWMIWRYENQWIAYVVALASWLIWLPLVYVLNRVAARHRPCLTDGCARCGYDMTGNVSGVCPECGSPAEHQKPRCKST